MHIQRTILIVALAGSTAIFAQERRDIYADPQNLKVLPADISSADLRNTMKGFAIGTGLRCSSCHVGEEGQDLTTYDFSSDEKELKATARKMLKMVNTINADYIATLGEDHDTRVACVTCHRGVPHPELTGQVLAEAAEEGGADAIPEKWNELKDQYYGTHSYDFSELTLSELARERFGAGKPDEARAVLGILVAEYPQSLMGWFMLGEIDRLAGDVEAARANYERALEINPDAGFVKQQLDAMSEQGDPE